MDDKNPLLIFNDITGTGQNKMRDWDQLVPYKLSWPCSTCKSQPCFSVYDIHLESITVKACPSGGSQSCWLSWHQWVVSSSESRPTFLLLHHAYTNPVVRHWPNIRHPHHGRLPPSLRKMRFPRRCSIVQLLRRPRGPHRQLALNRNPLRRFIRCSVSSCEF